MFGTMSLNRLDFWDSAMTTTELMKLEPIRHQLRVQAIAAMNEGDYVTIISYIAVPRGTSYISGQTFNHCHLVAVHHN